MMQAVAEHVQGQGFPGIRWLGSNGDRSTSPRAASSPSTAPSRPASLLIVEDDWFIAMDIRNVVAAAGYRVPEIATTADEAVAAAVAGRPDLVLMDIRLVGARDGIDAALTIRERLDIPCLMVSAHQDARLQARVAAARPRGWLMKPFSDQQLLAAINAALQGNHAG